MAFIRPGDYSKSRLDQAGSRIRNGNSDQTDLDMLENWRASHLYVINTFQSALRGRRRRFSGGDITIAQRLKRRPTIVDKLQREDGMSLSRMHDIAGCRLIFDSIENLDLFRQGVLSGRFSHEHIGGAQKYNYILDPKVTGYRGVHDVYKYNVNSIGGRYWNGLRIEIQYRTKIQHAWATAVEISDIVNSTRLKFNSASKNISRLFVICSEILSRAHESMPGPCGNVSDSDLLNEFDELEHNIHVIARLRNLMSSSFTEFARKYKLFILVNYTSGNEAPQTQAFGFFDNKSAVERYSRLESELQGRADVVLVGAGQQDAIKLAYTNYFSDASQFIRYLDSGRAKLR